MTGIILAGGSSSRMGKDKALLKLGGKTLLETAIENLKPLCSKILISSNHIYTEYQEYEFVKDVHVNIGPMGGIYSCLNASRTKFNIVLSVDSPFADQHFFRYLMSFKETGDVVIPIFEGRIYPMTGIYRKNFTELLHKEIKLGHYKMITAIKKTKFSFIKISEDSEFCDQQVFSNINTIEDLEKAKKRIKDRS